MKIENLTRSESIKNFVINLVLNAAIAYYMFHGVDSIPMMGKHGFAIDIFATAFMLTLTFCYIVIGIHSKNYKVIRSSLPNSSLFRLVGRLPKGPLLASCVVTLLVVSVIAPVSLAALFILEVTSISDLNYIIFKALWSGALGYVLTYVAIYSAKSSMERS